MLVSELRKNQNGTFDIKHLYTKTLCKMNDPRDFWCGVAHFGFSVRNMILINKIKIFVIDGKHIIPLLMKIETDSHSVYQRLLTESLY